MIQSFLGACLRLRQSTKSSVSELTASSVLIAIGKVSDDINSPSSESLSSLCLPPALQHHFNVGSKLGLTART